MKLLRRVVSVALSPVGLTQLNYVMLGSLRRPEWVYRARGRLPTCGISFTAPEPVSEDEVRLCARLIGAYAAATGSAAPGERVNGMWSWIIDSHHRELAAALDSGDAHRLAELLATMFRQDFMLGIAAGSMGPLHARSRLGSRVWSLRSLDALLSLAEALGVVRTENPEQGVLGHAFEQGPLDVVQRIESALDVSLDFPRIGAPYGIEIGGRLITLDWPEQCYAAARLRTAIRLHSQGASGRLVEIGAGYGGMAYWVLLLIEEIESYTIIDLPIVNVLQGYFLSRSVGSDRVSLFGEPARTVAILPAAAGQEPQECDVVVNKDSLPEMPERTVDEYLAWIGASCRGMFFSYNQEAYSPFADVPQTHVPGAVRRAGIFELVRRDHSWLRRGYAEEVYAVHPA